MNWFDYLCAILFYTKITTMSTIKSTETPELEQVSIAEDASIEIVEQISENNTPEEPSDDATPEQDDQGEVVVEYQIAGKSKAELVDMLAFLLEQDLVEDIRHYVEEIKTAFYKIHRQQVDAQIEVCSVRVGVHVLPRSDIAEPEDYGEQEPGIRDAAPCFIQDVQ